MVPSKSSSACSRQLYASGNKILEDKAYVCPLPSYLKPLNSDFFFIFQIVIQMNSMDIQTKISLISQDLFECLRTDTNILNTTVYLTTR